MTRKRQRAFTLIELVIVIIIIAILGTVLGGIIRSVAGALVYAVNYTRAMTIADEITDTLIEGDPEPAGPASTDWVPGLRYATYIFQIRFITWDVPQLFYSCPLEPYYDPDGDGISYVTGWPAKNDMRVVDIMLKAYNYSDLIPGPHLLKDADGNQLYDGDGNKLSTGYQIIRGRFLRRITGFGTRIDRLWTGNAFGGYEDIPYYHADLAGFSIGTPNLLPIEPNFVFWSITSSGSSIFPSQSNFSASINFNVRVGGATYRVARRVETRFNPHSAGGWGGGGWQAE